MKIKKILTRHRRDFLAIYECEHCGNEERSDGYDDSFFHNEVIPNMVCKNCNQKASEDYKPIAPRFPDGMII